MTYKQNKRRKVKKILKKVEENRPLEAGEVRAIGRYTFKEQEARDARR